MRVLCALRFYNKFIIERLVKLNRFRDVEECISVTFSNICGILCQQTFHNKSIFLAYRSEGFNDIFILTVHEKCIYKVSFHVNDVDAMVASDSIISVH